MQAVRTIEAFLIDAGCTALSAQELAVVAEELLSNIVRDAWGGREPGVCAVDVEAAALDRTVEVRLRTEDDGVAFDPLAAPAPDLDLTLEERPLGGMGIALVRAMTDAQIYVRTDGRNVLEVRKTCPCD